MNRAFNFGLAVGLAIWIGGVAWAEPSAGGLRWYADADRDGQLHPTHDAIESGVWSWRRGVIVPVDVDDDDRDGRADGLKLTGTSPGDTAYVRLMAPGKPPEDARLRFNFDAPEGAAALFVWVEGIWRALDLDETWPAGGSQLLAVKAARFAGPDWDGRLSLTATLFTPGGDADSATLAMRVAPFVLANSTQRADTVFIRAYPERNDEMVTDLGRIVARAGAELHVVPGDAPYPAHHIWLQDAVEFGHGWTGRPDAIRVAMPSNRNRDVDRFAAPRLVGPGVGVITVGGHRPEFALGEGGVSWIDWYGNLEATPPTPTHPFGAAIYGYDPATGARLNPEVVAFLDAQQVQPTLALDVGWLLIKHVDEMVSFMPADDPDWPYRLVVPDTTVALEVLEQIVADGHGDTPMLTTYEEGVTAARLLSDQGFVAHNRELQAERIEPNVDLLCQTLGIDPEHVVRLPALFTTSGAARLPNVVNALIVNGHVVMSDPDGPELPGQLPGVRGGDPFQIKVREILADLPVTVHFVDDQLYHRWSGNVHCATNAMRQPLEVNATEEKVEPE